MLHAAWAEEMCESWHTFEMSGRWAEEAIKAQLRDLTEHTRKLRQELETLISGPETPRSRRFLRQNGSPKDPDARGVSDESTPRRKR
jgi:hypothetical protein